MTGVASTTSSTALEFFRGHVGVRGERLHDADEMLPPERHAHARRVGQRVRSRAEGGNRTAVEAAYRVRRGGGVAFVKMSTSKVVHNACG